MNRFLTDESGLKLAYQKTEGEGPGVIFLGGFHSDMTGTKASYLEACCREWGKGYVRFDYFAHGASDGNFIDGTLGRWLSDTLRVIDTLATGPQILVGSSMGGWLMLLAALARPERVHALVGIAAAPDFLNDALRMTQEQQTSLEETGVFYIEFEGEEQPVPISKELITEAGQYNVLHEAININCPVRLLHGLSDAEVDWQKSVKIAERLTSSDAQVILVKNGDHRLSSDVQLRLLSDTVKSLWEK